MRLDSGDLGEHACQVRAILDRSGLSSVAIFASGNLDEYLVRRLVAEGAPIDGFGVGTRLDTSSDAPYLDCVYKLQEYAGQPRRKRSEGKATWPGRKQVWRRYDEAGCCCGDSLMLEGEAGEGQALIQPVMQSGRRLAPSPSLEAVRAHALCQLDSLPPALQDLEPAPAYPVEVSDALRLMAAAIDRQAGWE
ncbi:hypothetical protein ACE0DR_13230 [Azotobacter sp. CWF10]